MTIFSYFYSNFRQKRFREPELLNILLGRWSVRLSVGTPLSGWVIHYFVGLIFVGVYHIYWWVTDSVPSLTNCILLGFVSGLIGIAGWRTVFKIHPNPPPIDFKEFAALLVVAHIIFGVGSFIALDLLSL